MYNYPNIAEILSILKIINIDFPSGVKFGREVAKSCSINTFVFISDNDKPGLIADRFANDLAIFSCLSI